MSPHDELDCAGDQTYAPPELLYGYIPQDWRVRRLGCEHVPIRQSPRILMQRLFRDAPAFHSA